MTASAPRQNGWRRNRDNGFERQLEDYRFGAVIISRDADIETLIEAIVDAAIINVTSREGRLTPFDGDMWDWSETPPDHYAAPYEAKSW